MVFIRLQGCNLISSCSYCDTVYAQNSNLGKEMSVEEVVSEVSKLLPYYRSWVCITGGEPLWQEPQLYELVIELKKGGYRTTIETNGSIKPPRWYTLVDSWNADIKCPSSGVCGVSKETWFNTRASDQIKFVVGTQEDLDFTREVLSRHRTDSPTIIVSPVIQLRNKLPDNDIIWNQEWLQEVVEFAKEMRIHYSLQIHKVLYGNKRGV